MVKGESVNFHILRNARAHRDHQEQAPAQHLEKVDLITITKTQKKASPAIARKTRFAENLGALILFF